MESFIQLIPYTTAASVLDVYLSITGVIKWVALILGFIICLFLLYLWYKSVKFLEDEHHDMMHPHGDEHGDHAQEHDDTSHTQSSLPANQMHEIWYTTKRYGDSTIESEWKLGIIEADKIVDEVLIQQGYLGDSMGERLMSIDPSRFLTLQEVWDAHKLRNMLVHDMTQTITQQQAQRAIESYERFLTELGFFT